MKSKRLLHVVGLVGLMVLALVGAVQASDPGEPQPGTVRGLGGPHTFYVGGVLTETTYTASPRVVYGQDVSQSWLWHAVDVFVTADVSGTDVITVTPQLSVDAANWADATYTYIAQTWTQETDGVTTTTTSVSAPAEATYRIVMSADGTDYLRMPLAGRYLRFRIETSGTVTPTIQALFRND